MLRIGLTGGIGTGKSAACRIFAELGAPVIDADQISREVVAPGEPVLNAIAVLFGDSALNADGSLNRSRVRERIFAEPALRQQLENLLHPLIKQRMREQAQACRAPYVILAIPLLLEVGWQELVDRVLVIDCPVEQQISRTMRRDGVTREQAQAIIASQMARNERLRQADDIVINDSNLDHLHSQIIALHRRYLQMAEPSPAK